MGDQSRLELQATQIEATLASHKVRVRVPGGTVTPRFVRYDLMLEGGTRLRRVNELSEEIALALQAPACRVLRRGGRVQVEVPREDPKRVPFARVCDPLGNPSGPVTTRTCHDPAMPTRARVGVSVAEPSTLGLDSQSCRAAHHCWAVQDREFPEAVMHNPSSVDPHACHG